MEVDQENKNIEKLSSGVALRVKLREDLYRNQELNRFRAFEKNRFLESEIFSEDEILGICSRLKRRKQGTQEDLIKLATAFYQSETNISAFIKITGAINVVIKEFIGHTDRQILAAQTICNMSLGNDACCSKIATFAGAYLMIYIRNFTHVSLNKICIWTLQNLISSSGHKAMDILMSQELLYNTLNIINNSGDVDLKHEAIQLLDLIIERKWASFTMDEKEEVTKIVLNYVKSHESDHVGLECLYKIVSSGAWNIDKQESNKLLNLLGRNIVKPNDNQHLIYFSIKILNIMFQSDHLFLETFLENLKNSDIKLSSIINEALKVPKFFSLAKDFLHLSAQIYQCRQPVALNYLAFDDLVNNLEVSKIFEF